MKKILLNLLRCIVGSEFGWTGEGNEQWYYFLALVINVMLTWWLKPELGIIFTVAAVIHYVTVCVYGYAMLDIYSVWYSVIYYAIHAIIFIVCCLFNWKWTLLTSVIVILAYCIAPDCCAQNIFGTGSREAIFLFHTILFVTFLIIVFKLPIALWIKLVIIVSCMILHPLVDFLESECIIISDVTAESFGNIVDFIRYKKDKKNC